ncbi:MAG: MBL fold metallo-hydrolase [Candidatus Omnitrophica bacterium]|nr:MBL fold metallo-hydrolase [Candidatus Omnitrophota bacterium]
MTVTIEFLGGVGNVTGSMHLLTVGRHRVLIDCGLFQGRRDESYEVNSEFAFEPSGLTACIISHAHIDHCGNFPTLVRKGFRNNAYVTPSTLELCNYMLPDSGHIQEEDVKYVNKINRRRGMPARWPLYTQHDAERSLHYLKKIEYHRPKEIAPGVVLTFFDAGHILGSSIPTIDITTKTGPIRIAYAVDLGRPDLPYLRDPQTPKDIDYLLIESTYGATRHPPIENIEKELADVVNRTVRRSGKIIIPSFALERTQEVLYFLGRLLKKKKIREVPVYVDSPLACNVTSVFRENWQYFDEDMRDAFRRGEDPLRYKNITYIRDVEQSKRLHDKTGPMIIISASGMCESGRILHHLKNNIENPNNTIVVVGFMAKDTLGRKIVERKATVNIFGRPYQLKAEVVSIKAFSAHADMDFLINYAKECGKHLKKVFVVHGEISQSEELRKNLRAAKIKALIPKKGQVVELIHGGQT